MSLAGRIFLHSFHQPWGRLRDLWLDGGPRQRRLTEAGRLAMLAAASQLPAIQPPTDPAAPEIELQLLTGQRYWFQTAFLLTSLAPHARIRATLHDDGTLAGTPALQSLLRIAPGSRLEPIVETEARLDATLPRSRFPALRSRRDDLVLMRKLLDVHVGRTGWRLFLDSDMLFLARPSLLLELDRSRARPLHMTDVDNAYGYPVAELDRLAGHPVPRRVNTGLLGLRSETIDWDDLERVCAELNRRPHYFQEQALFAHILSRQDPLALPAADYRVLPDRTETLHPRAVLHHFVAHSKRGYYQLTWHRFAASPTTS